MREYTTELKSGITRSKEFKKNAVPLEGEIEPSLSGDVL
jgi:hypothetical protein